MPNRGNTNQGKEQPKTVDYISTFVQVFFIFVGLFAILVQQQVWRSLFFVQKQVEKRQELEKIKPFVTKLLRECSHKLAEETGTNDLPVDVARKKKEEAFMALNGAKQVIKTIRNMVIPLNPFWKFHCEYEVPAEVLNQSTYVYMANHTSYSDFVFVAGLQMHYAAVAKGDLLDIPVVKNVLQNSGILPVHFKRLENKKWGVDKEKTKEMLSKAVDYLKCGLSVVVFPEGQIGTKYELEKFKDGFFKVAKDAGVKIVPISLHGADKVWPMARKHVPRMPMGVGSCHVKVGSPIEFLPYDRMGMMNEVDEIVDFVKENYGVKLDEVVSDPCREEIFQVISEILDFNKTEHENSTPIDFEKKTDTLFKLIVRQKILSMRKELEVKAAAAAQK